MSYEIVKSIKIDEKSQEVYLTSCSNNVSPRTPHKWECGTLSKILKEQGKEALEIEILKTYDSGSFQSTNNKYTKALKILQRLPKYADFDWRGNFDNYEQNKKERAEEWEGMLKTALNSKLPETKYIITKKLGDNIVYFCQRKNSGLCRWKDTTKEATIFDYKDEAESTKKCFYSSESWEITKLN